MKLFLILKLIIALPFISFLPGFFLTPVTQIKTTNRIEQFVVAIFLSLFCVYLVLNILEKTVQQLTPSNVFITIAAINVLCVLIFSLHRASLSPTDFFIRLYRKLHKRNKE